MRVQAALKANSGRSVLIVAATTLSALDSRKALRPLLMPDTCVRIRALDTNREYVAVGKPATK